MYIEDGMAVRIKHATTRKDVQAELVSDTQAILVLKDELVPHPPPPPPPDGPVVELTGQWNTCNMQPFSIYVPVLPSGITPQQLNLWNAGYYLSLCVHVPLTNVEISSNALAQYEQHKKRGRPPCPQPPPQPMLLPLTPDIWIAPSFSIPPPIPPIMPMESVYLSYLQNYSYTDVSMNGNSKCGYDCTTCSIIEEGATFRSNVTRKSYIFTGHATCQTTNVIYLMQCKQCNMQYVGQTTKTLNLRMQQHKSVKTPIHDCPHNLLTVKVIEAHVYRYKDETSWNNPTPLDRSERLWMMELQTMRPYGMNIA